MRIDIVTIFPQVVSVLYDYSVIGRAIAGGILTVNAVNPRDFTEDKHRQVDDYPYGGGAGMVLKPEPMFRAVEHICAQSSPDEVIVMSAGGRMFNQEVTKALAAKNHLILICGHYEGIDQRVIDQLATMELSIGDYVLTGGELPALVVVDAVSRLLPGVLGNRQSVAEESFEGGLLEYPQYTRPAVFRGLEVPPVLLSGNHQEVARWRREMAVQKTKSNRPELLDKTRRRERI